VTGLPPEKVRVHHHLLGGGFGGRLVTQAVQIVVAKQAGDVAKAMAGAARTIEAVYQQPLLAHATMEPFNCTVDVHLDGCDVWVGTQVISARPLRCLVERTDQVRTGELGVRAPIPGYDPEQEVLTFRTS